MSQPAVSNILNAKAHLYRPETRDKVLRAAREMGYRANAAARATATGRFDSVALLLSTLPDRSTLFRGLIEGIHDALAARDLHLTLARLPDEKLADRGYVPKILKQCLVDGLLINYFDRIPPALVEMIDTYRLPVVWLNSRQEANCVYPDDEDAARRATVRLLALGHRRVMFVNYSGDTHYSAAARYAGYAAAMRDAGLVPRSAREVTPRAGRVEAARRWLDVDLSQRPTAVVAYSSTSAWPVREAAMSLRRSVPRDLSLVTFEDHPCNEVGIQIDTMVVPEAAMGREAVRMLLERIEAPGPPLPNAALPFDYAPGETLVPPAPEDRAATARATPQITPLRPRGRGIAEPKASPFSPSPGGPHVDV